MNIAVIPARSGSKRLPGKNIKDLCGKPMLAWSIEAAKKSKMFEKIIVSTDSARYEFIAREYGAKSLLRSMEYATDTASSWDVVKEVLDSVGRWWHSDDTVCLLQPTSPLRTAEDIIIGYKILRENNAYCVVGVCETDPPMWCNTLPESGRMENFINKLHDVPRENLPKYFKINGALYIVGIDYLEHMGSIYGAKTFAYVMPRERSVDVDTEFDFKVAEALCKS